MQFGGQEFPDPLKVVDFAKGRGFDGTVMDIADVAGSGARPSWKLFYKETGAPEPTWNFKVSAICARAKDNKTESSAVAQRLVLRLALQLQDVLEAGLDDLGRWGAEGRGFGTH